MQALNHDDSSITINKCHERTTSTYTVHYSDPGPRDESGVDRFLGPLILRLEKVPA
jgi:hypothetical protein